MMVAVASLARCRRERRSSGGGASSGVLLAPPASSVACYIRRWAAQEQLFPSVHDSFAAFVNQALRCFLSFGRAQRQFCCPVARRSSATLEERTDNESATRRRRPLLFREHAQKLISLPAPLSVRSGWWQVSAAKKDRSLGGCLLFDDFIESSELLDPLSNLRRRCIARIHTCTTRARPLGGGVLCLVPSALARERPTRTSARVRPSCCAPAPLRFISSRCSHLSWISLKIASYSSSSCEATNTHTGSQRWN